MEISVLYPILSHYFKILPNYNIQQKIHLNSQVFWYLWLTKSLSSQQFTSSILYFSHKACLLLFTVICEHVSLSLDSWEAPHKASLQRLQNQHQQLSFLGLAKIALPHERPRQSPHRLKWNRVCPSSISVTPYSPTGILSRGFSPLSYKVSGLPLTLVFYLRWSSLCKANRSFFI